jgi:cyclopropane fatty-acyl-phospholipid synthase-like methyltransferase
VASLEKDIAASYNQAAEERDSYSLPDWKVEEREIFLEKIKAEKRSDLLEIGAGQGRIAYILKIKVYKRLVSIFLLR